MLPGCLLNIPIVPNAVGAVSTSALSTLRLLPGLLHMVDATLLNVGNGPSVTMLVITPLRELPLRLSLELAVLSVLPVPPMAMPRLR